jgi:hypothetical protein
MNSAYDHNYDLQHKGTFTTADLKENQQGRYSQAQLKQFENSREFMTYSANKYDNRGPLISMIFGVGLLGFAAVLYFIGVFDMFRAMLGGLFLPVMAGLGILAALFVFVIIPRSFQSSVEMAKGMGTPLAESPLGEIQVIEARAEKFETQGGINRRGRQTKIISHILKMDGIEFKLQPSFWELIDPKRLYRVYCVKDQGVWVLLSMETLE